MATNFTATIRSMIGTRDEQQDSAFYQIDDHVVMAIVCDGMGGLESGTVASVSAVEKFKELYQNKDVNESFPTFLLKAVDILDEFVFNLKDEKLERLGAGTTLTAVVIENNHLYWLSIGDSRLYILRDAEFVQITRDHNYFLHLNQLLQEQQISDTEYQAESVKGETLVSFVGMGGIKVMDLNHVPFELLPNDKILLTTDGLYKALSNEEIMHCLNTGTLEQSAMILINKINGKMRKFQDNTTFVIIKYKEAI